MDIKQYLDSTYLKTVEQAGLTKKENIAIAVGFIKEAVAEKFKLVMIRPEMVKKAVKIVKDAKSLTDVGTVIDFPNGNGGLAVKMDEAQQAVLNGADELDLVADYMAFKEGDIKKVKEEIIACTQFGIENGKIVKWIIETAALSPAEIVQFCALIKNCVVSNFNEDSYFRVFIKSSTGFYKTENGLPNGATLENIKLMLENSFPLQVKASGGIRNYDEAVQLIKLGVKRIGTSSAKAIADGKSTDGAY